jgi:hypothetical protein
VGRRVNNEGDSGVAMTKRFLTYFALLGMLGNAAPLLAADTFSQAEQKVFLDDHMRSLKPAEVLQYSFRKTGSLEEAFEDKVLLSVKSSSDGKHKAVAVSYLSGDRKLNLPDDEDVQANPIIKYFLEQDVREMRRRTGGKENYFRKRIRMALAETADVRAVAVKINGKEIPANEVRIQPYLNDPMRARFPKFENKTYVFVLCDQVPGSVYELRTRVDDPTPAGNADQAAKSPLIEEILTFNKLNK